MKYQITKQFSFEAAHRLLRNYTGKCTNNHGHSFNVKLFLEGNELDNKDMLLDFVETKALKQWIDEKLDHATLLWEHDDLATYLESQGHNVFRTVKNPTSEHIAEIILEKAQQIFQNTRIKVYCIEVNETCTTGARIFP